jgi:predicted lipid-binding transport protein (Tim44 family)
MEDIKQEIKVLETKQSSIEKEIATANARYEAHLEMLQKEFGVGDVSKIDELIKQHKITADDLKHIIDESLKKLKTHIGNLEVIVRGK